MTTTATEEEYAAFTLRIPKQLKAQIEMRAKVQHRTRNAEIVHMLTHVIDTAVARDTQLKREHSKG
ncbi:hypothetical protein Phage2-1_00017 [Achromobacter phage 2-1]|nr:hypothetical protein Phage2-1_00017 [Achromobacter phage 2-1]